MRAGACLVVIHYRDDPALVESLPRSLAKHADRTLFAGITVVGDGGRLDNAGRSRLEKIAVGPKVTIARNEEMSDFSGVNVGVRASPDERVVVSNNDLEWLPHQSIAPLVGAFADPRDGVAGSQLRYLDARSQRSQSALPSVGRALAYGFLARIRPAAYWQSRCQLARARYLAARRQ